MILAPEHMLAAAEATWPPAVRRRVDGWTIREGRGGGSRVRAATAGSPVRADERPAGPALAEQAMRNLGQAPLVIVPGMQEGLDARWLAPPVTRTNAATLALHASAGMAQVAEYHHRGLPA